MVSQRNVSLFSRLNTDPRLSAVKQKTERPILASQLRTSHPSIAHSKMITCRQALSPLPSKLPRPNQKILDSSTSNTNPCLKPPAPIQTNPSDQINHAFQTTQALSRNDMYAFPPPCFSVRAEATTTRQGHS